MRRTNLLVVLSLAVIVSTAMAEDKPAISPGVPPIFRKVFQINRQQGELLLTNRTIRFVAEPLAIKAKGDGKGGTVAHTTYKPVYETRTGTITVDSAEVFEAGGKKLASEDVWKRVSVGTIVLVSADGKKVAPEYINTLAKDTLIFVSPQHAFQDNFADAGEGDWSARPAYGQSFKPRAVSQKP